METPKDEFSLIVMRTEPDYEQRNEDDKDLLLALKINDHGALRTFVRSCEESETRSDVGCLEFENAINRATRDEAHDVLEFLVEDGDKARIDRFKARFGRYIEEPPAIEGFMFGTYLDEHRNASALSATAFNLRHGMVMFSSNGPARANLDLLTSSQPNFHPCRGRLEYDPTRDRLHAIAGSGCLHTFGPVTHKGEGCLAGDNTSTGCLAVLKEHIGLR